MSNGSPTRRGGTFSGGKKVGGNQESCADPHTGLIVFVRHKITKKPIAMATVKAVGPTALTAVTGAHGMGSWFPIPPGKYKVHVTLDPATAAQFEPIPDTYTTAPKGYCWNHTVYAVPLARLRVKVLARKRRRVQGGQRQVVVEPLHGVVVRVNELGTTMATALPDGWADFGVVKPGRYTATVEFWGPHADRYELVDGPAGKQGIAVNGKVTEIILKAVRTGWIEFQVVYDKPKEGQKAEIPDVDIKLEVPGNRTGRRKTDANGVMRVERLDPGPCHVQEMTYDKEILEVVSG